MTTSSTQVIATDESKWQTYYENTSKRDPWPTLSKAIQSFNDEGEVDRTAIDVGCGSGRDTVHMIQNNWQVTAIDAEEVAGKFLKERIAPEKLDNLTFVASTYENYLFGKQVKLINASYALPFCSPEHLGNVMERISQSISTGGRFAGHFFGPNDSWASDTTMTFTNSSEVRKFFATSFTLEHFEEKEWDGPSGSGPKHWHVFDVIAKKA